MPSPQLTLAADFGELVVISIGLVIMVGGWVASQLREMHAKKKQREEHLASTPLSAPRKTDEPLSIDELAARRRAQLQELARRRSAGQGASTLAPAPPTPAPARQSPPVLTPVSQAPAQPSNITMAQMEQRARAKAEYERRARALREAEALKRAEQTHQSAPQPAPPRRPAPPQRPTPQRRPQRQPTPGGQQPVIRRQPAPLPVAELEEVRGPLGSGATDVHENTHRDSDTGHSDVHRHVSDAHAPARAAAVPEAFGRLKLTGNALRDAIILKELLDPPVGLRE